MTMTQYENNPVAANDEVAKELAGSASNFISALPISATPRVLVRSATLCGLV